MRRVGRVVGGFVLMISAVPLLAAAAFSGANGLIAFDTDRDGNREIYVVNPDGTGLRNLTNHPETDAQPQWSPDGTRILFRRGTDDPSRELWVMNADGSGQTPLTSNAVEDEEAAWSPDGTRIVFVFADGAEKQLYVMNADGTDPVRLTSDQGAEEREPAWSPDGASIAYRRALGGSATREIFVVDADGSNPRQLTDNDAEDRRPAWSPDGARIAFDSERDGGSEIYVMNADGSGVTQLTTDGEDSSEPDWSPDGTQIVYRAFRESSYDVYTVNVNGTNTRRVTTSDAEDVSPTWQPIFVANEAHVAGKKLLLKDDDAKPDKRRLVILLKDKSIDLGGGNGSADDPTMHGGALRVVSAAGGFGTKYDLPAAAWAYKGKVGKNKGYKLKGAGPITKILVKAGKLIKIVGKGAELGHRLGADPDPVHVAVTLGGRTYCGSFGGKAKLVPNKKYLAKQASAPAECTLGPICGDGVREELDSCATLEGPADGLAVEATTNYDGEPGVPEAEIEEEAPGVEVARTRLHLEFMPGATVAEVDAVLASLDAEILMMVRDAPLLVVRIPDPGSLAALETLIASAGTTSVRVFKAHFHDIDELPGNYDPLASSNLTLIDHQLSVGAPAAWNARAAATDPPRLVIGDSFGGGAPTADVSVTLLDPSDFAMTTLEDHGYHVLGIATATFGGTAACSSGISLLPSTLRGCATGMMPVTVPLRVADDQDSTTVLGLNMRIILRAFAADRTVLNTSLNNCCDGTCGDLAVAGEAARQWLLLVRGAGLEDNILHLTSAGNIDLLNQNSCKDQLDADAVTNSAYTAAALHPAIPDATGMATLPNLTNILVVENVRNGFAPDFAPRCLSGGSKFPGQISGIGTDVLSHTDAGASADFLSGTSMSTPQVAGLAAYLWAIAPTMTVPELRSLLRQTATPVVVGSINPPCSPIPTQPQPIIDAYAAVLALDDAVLPTPATAPVRHAILDDDGSTTFDHVDLQAFLSHYFDGYVDAENPGTPVTPTTPDWSRWDLNGDGMTGGPGTRPFDLDRIDSTQYGTSGFTQVRQTIEEASIPFDETALTDLEILCYYAYSDLWGGPDDARTALLGSALCNPFELTASFPPTVTPGTPVSLVVSLGERTATGTQPVAGARIETIATGGVVTPPTGLTDAQGEFAPQGEVIAGNPTMDVEVRAVDGPGGAVLARTTVSAQSTGPVVDPYCSVVLKIGRQPDRSALAGPLVGTDTEGPVFLQATADPHTSYVEASWDIDNAPWIYDGGIEILTKDLIEITPTNPGDGISRMRHRIRFTYASDVNVRSKPERSQGWFEFDTSGFNPGGTIGFGIRNLGGTRAEQVTEVVYEKNAFPLTTLDVRIRLSTFTGFGGELVDTSVDGSVTIEWLGIDEVLDFGGNSIPFTYRSLCSLGGPVGTSTTSTTTSSSTSTTSSTSTSTTSTSVTTSSVTTVTSTTSTTTSTLPGGGGPFYRVYGATGGDGPTVTSTDQIRTEMIDLGSVVQLLVPASFDGSGVVEPAAYQTCYAHPGAPFAATAQVANVFGAQTLTMSDPASLCTFESATSAPTDEFNCYAAAGTAIGQGATLVETFNAETVTVTDPTVLCVPTSVDGSVVVNPVAGLACYDTTTTGSAIGMLGIDNRFGLDTLDAGAPTGVCLPTTLSSIVP